MWKIDHYDPTMTHLSSDASDAADPISAMRVLTIMPANGYPWLFRFRSRAGTMLRTDKMVGSILPNQQISFSEVRHCITQRQPLP
ncbi:DUF3768 domain-containing protein [Azospirillum sp. B2RO_4]|uniref:DUF3768 domain-containing protein n=1 Tax=Azospirillum sp. B2RO_4 TaxID=3027796 RepID=UPI003DA84EA4